MTKSATINLRALNAISLCASDEETRYYLNGVLVELEANGVRYVATNGHILAGHRDAYPGEATENLLTGAFIIPAAICKAFKLVTSDVMNLATLTLRDDGRLELTRGDESRVFDAIDGTFPDYMRVIPSAPNGKPAHYNPAYLAIMQKVGSVLRAAKRGSAVIPQIAQDDSGPGLINWLELPESFGVIMPVRVSEKPSVPEWAKARADYTVAEIAQAAE